jgi:hypothetical protein
MGKDQEWLRAERSGQDRLAEEAFARLMAELPPIEPGAGFVDGAAQAAWRARARHRAVARLARAAAALLVGLATLGAAYLWGALATGLIARGAAGFSQGLVWLLASAGEGARWWWIADRISTAVSVAISSAPTAAAMVMVEIAALLALYAFRNLVLGKTETNESRKMQT